MGAADGESEIFAPGLMSGQVALVSGVGSGLGKASALELARCGANVVISGRRDQVLGEAAKEIGERCGGAERSRAGERSGAAERGGQADWVAGDVRTPDGAEALVRATLERYGRLDVLVNNAGGQYFTPAELIAAKGWRAVWRLNVGGILNMAEAAFELAFGPAGAGNIVNITLSPHHGMPGMAHSGSARATVEALTREMAERWADADVVVTAVAAGHFGTEVTAKYPESVRAGAARSVPLQRLGEAHEHAWLVALLASPLGRALNGSTLTLDGARDNWFGPWPPAGLADESGEVPTVERR